MMAIHFQVKLLVVHAHPLCPASGSVCFFCTRAKFSTVWWSNCVLINDGALM